MKVCFFLICLLYLFFFIYVYYICFFSYVYFLLMTLMLLQNRKVIVVRLLNYFDHFWRFSRLCMVVVWDSEIAFRFLVKLFLDLVFVLR